ncbi:unnamed protein product [Sphagnum balticum]
MDAASSTNDDASCPRFSDDEGEGPGVVRLQIFSLDVQPSGLRFTTAGGDHKVILVHERRPGLRTMKFGSGKPPDVENWKVPLTLRGHTADVVDLGWSPDNILLVNCSLDNTVHVWLAATSSPVTVLTSYVRLVKGVPWDPIGSFLATQSNDECNHLAHQQLGTWSSKLKDHITLT